MQIEKENSRTVIRVAGVFIGFFILIISLSLGNLIFSKFYNSAQKDIPILFYELIVLSATMISIFYMVWKYKFIPKFIKRSFKESIMISGAGIVIIWFLWLFFLTNYYQGKSSSLFVQSLLNLPTKKFIIGSILTIILGPMLEEILDRGFFFELMKIRWNTTISLVITLLFSLITHVGTIHNNVDFIFHILNVIIFSVLYMKGGLLASILPHMFVNLYSVYIISR